ncbi:hypothetical protein AB0M44_22000 [Streptosporangium subroseum]|uniref:hypothetical protein n=1 Tax=Streptosporangium subroseum TaxID=106412 RepID=UPI0034488C1E
MTAYRRQVFAYRDYLLAPRPRSSTWPVPRLGTSMFSTISAPTRFWRGRPLGCQLSESKQQEFAAGPVGAVAAAQLHDASHDFIGGEAQRGSDVFGSTQKFMVSGRHEDVLPFGALWWVTPLHCDRRLYPPVISSARGR